jgi:hypothetical protein
MKHWVFDYADVRIMDLHEVTVEQFYQAFKARLMEELVAVKERDLGNCFVERNEFPLVAKEG